MIARIWRGWAPLSTARDYESHYKTEVEPKLRAVPGFHGGKLLRRENGDDVEFTSITYFTSIADIRAFAGPAYEQAVVDEPARAALSRWDEKVEHHDVAVDLTDKQ